MVAMAKARKPGKPNWSAFNAARAATRQAVRAARRVWLREHDAMINADHESLRVEAVIRGKAPRRVSRRVFMDIMRRPAAAPTVQAGAARAAKA